MSLIKVIKGADFSAANIGKINLPIRDTDFLAYMDKIVTDPTLAKKYVIRDFILQLKKNKLWDKIDYILIPKNSASILDSSQNVKNKGNIDLPIGASQLASLGVNFTNAIVDNFSIELNKSSFHIGAYNTTADGDNTIGRVSIAIDGDNIILGRRIANAFADSGLQVGGTAGRCLVVNHASSIGMMLGSASVTENAVNVLVDGEANSIDYLGTNYGITTNVLLDLGALNTWQSTASYGFFTFGKYMTPQELAIYESLINTLMISL